MTETQTVDLAAWLTAIWDEEERLAKRAAQEIPGHNPDHPYCIDPSMVLARIAADRKILELHSVNHECTNGRETLYIERAFDDLCPTVRLLASPYKGRDGWQEEWADE